MRSGRLPLLHLLRLLCVPFLQMLSLLLVFLFYLLRSRVIGFLFR